VATQASADVITLPNPTTVPTVSYGDFISYSLPVLNTFLNTTQFTIGSSPGQINPVPVIGTGAGGINNNEFAGMSQPLPFPNNPPVPGDFSGTWTTPVSTLTSYLGGNGLAVMFNFNQTANTQNIQAFAQVILTGPGGAQTVFQLSGPPPHGLPNNPGSVFAFSAGSVIPDPTNADDFTNVNLANFLTAHGRVCVSQTDIQFDLTSAQCAQLGANYTFFNQNLGANQAVFAIVSPELDAALYSGLYNSLKLNIWMTGLDNGYEQAFIFANTNEFVPVPEPAAIAVLGLGFLSLGLARRRRRT
jgi:hypothetical protein